MKEYDFTFVLEGITEVTEEAANAFYEAGCDDASFTSCEGVAKLSFHREAISFEDAVLSAYQQTSKAIVKLHTNNKNKRGKTNTISTVSRIEPDDLVNIPEIAKRCKVSRQLVYLYQKGERGPGHFPAPWSSVNGKPVWKWSTVARWIKNNTDHEVSGVEHSDFIGAVNGLLQSQNYITTLSELSELWKQLKPIKI